MSMGRALVPTIAAVLIVAGAVALGNWQVRRGAQKLQLELQTEAAEQAEPKPLEPLLMSEPQVDVLEGQRAFVRGRLLPELSVYLDNRTYKGIAGFYVLTPLRIEGDATVKDGVTGPVNVLVLRGWVAGDPGRRSEPPLVTTPAGPIQLTGLVERELPQALELQHPGPPGPEQRIWQNLTRGAYASWSGLTLQPLLLRQLEPARGVEGPIDDGLIRDWPRPGLDVDKHRGYALQWYGIAATTAILWLWFVVLRPLRVRRTAANGGK